MAVGAAQRRESRALLIEEAFGDKAGLALDLLEVLDTAWHDVHGDVSFPDNVLDDLIVTSIGSTDRLIEMVRLALIDWRDLRVAADVMRQVD